MVNIVCHCKKIGMVAFSVFPFMLELILGFCLVDHQHYFLVLLYRSQVRPELSNENGSENFAFMASYVNITSTKVCTNMELFIDHEILVF